VRAGAKIAAGIFVVAVAIGSAVTPATAADRARGAMVESGTASTDIVRQSLAGFDAGNLIDDPVFFSKDTMSADQIQSFLNSKVPACQAGYTCLRNFGMATSSRPADAMCRSPYTGRGWESAAQIIYNVAQACGINPQVLLVTLQKEQGLVTHTWPSDWRYTIAMGQGCPDTAACDTRYYGFFNQVYGAAWQFKRYANPPGTSNYFTWYAPGRTWNIRYNPNAACGSSPVHVSNQATANLYYYTPYQPNSAALAAGYGTGDGCSSYGNRNFYNYFTDWFGTTRSSDMALAKSESSATVWIVSNGSRWAISSVAEWNELNRAFGPTYTVGDAFLASLTDRGVGSNVVRDSSTGTMAVIDEGRSWGLTSCAAVATWGGNCANPVDLSGRVFRRAATAPVVGNYLRVYGTAQWGLLENGGVRVLYDAVSATRLNGGAPPSAPRMTSRAYQALARTAVQFAPGELVYTSNGSTVYMTDGRTSLVPLSSWATVREMGIAPSSARLVPSSALAGYSPRTSPLMPLVVCGATTYLPASGKLTPLSDPARPGLGSTALDTATCQTLVLSTTPISAVLVKTSTDATVYSVEGGRKRALTSWSAAVELGGASPVILTVDASWLAAIPTTSPGVPDGTLIKGSSASIYLLDGGSLYGVTSFALTRELGLGDAFRQVADSVMSGYTRRSEIVGPWVTCGGNTLFAASGVLHAVRAPDAGARPIPLTDSTCRLLNATGAAVQSVFIKGSGATVYVARGGVFSPVASWSRLVAEAGGTAPTILTVSDAALRALPIGPVLS
jgi:hypothetical protein